MTSLAKGVLIISRRANTAGLKMGFIFILASGHAVRVCRARIPASLHLRHGEPLPICRASIAVLAGEKGPGARLELANELRKHALADAEIEVSAWQR
jgi:hypothetical protein